MKKKINLLIFKQQFEILPFVCLLLVVKNLETCFKFTVYLNYLLKHSYFCSFPSFYFKNIISFSVLNKNDLINITLAHKNIFALKIKNLFFIVTVQTFYFLLKFLTNQSLKLQLFQLNFFIMSFLFLLNRFII